MNLATGLVPPPHRGGASPVNSLMALLFGELRCMSAVVSVSAVSERCDRCTERNLGFGERSTAAQSETWVSVSAVPLHRAKPGFR